MYSHSDPANFRFYTQPGQLKFPYGQNPAVIFSIRLFLLICLLSGLTFTSGAQTLEVPVKLEVDKGNLDHVTVRVSRNGKEILTQQGSRNIKLKLDFNQKYILTFTKTGYITKTIEFSTNAPEARIKQGFDPYKIGIKLFEQNEENMVVYNQPVGKIRYDQTLDDFNFETDYSKSILSAMGEPEKPAAKEEAKAPAAETTVKEESNTSNSSAQAQAVVNEKPEPSAPPAPQNEFKVSQTVTTPIPHDTARIRATMTTGQAEEKKAPAVPQQEHTQIKISQPAQGNEEGYFKQPATFKESPPVSSPVFSADSPPMNSGGNSAADFPPGIEVPVQDQKITREDIVEKNRVIVRIKVIAGKKNTEYSFVNYRWGGRYFFRNNISITETLFTQWTGFMPESE